PTGRPSTTGCSGSKRSWATPHSIVAARSLRERLPRESQVKPAARDPPGQAEAPLAVLCHQRRAVDGLFQLFVLLRHDGLHEVPRHEADPEPDRRRDQGDRGRESQPVNDIDDDKIAISSDKPQTTRTRILGVKHLPDAQLVFVDTPGIHKPKFRLNQRMVETALNALAEVDLVFFLVEATEAPGPGDR